jgi:Pyruvate/2-oxoacid:ferredoxin oxidoreductase delta subunit
MDVFNLMPVPGSSSRQLSCDICGSEIEMVIDEGGQLTGSIEDVKARKAVRLRHWTEFALTVHYIRCTCSLHSLHSSIHSLQDTIHHRGCNTLFAVAGCGVCSRVCWWQLRGQAAA